MFSKKNAPSAKSLDLSMNDPCSGVSPVNKSGQVTDKTGQVVEWPFSVINLKPNAPPPITRNKADQVHSGNPNS